MVLHTFTAGNDGYNPNGGVIFGPRGALYGTTSCGGPQGGCGTVFRMAKNSSGSWTKTVLYSFTGSCPNNGQIPEAGLLFDKSGNLYGTTRQGGSFGCQNSFPGDGTVFELSPPASSGAPWTQKVLFSFNGNDGQMPLSRLRSGPGGALYGSTSLGGLTNEGTLFQLVPSNGVTAVWTLHALWDFGSNATDAAYPISDVLYLNGFLYGTTQLGGSAGDGTVYSWTP
jgi:uncharacterized repeat protein (TIGR03803 family)